MKSNPHHLKLWGAALLGALLLTALAAPRAPASLPTGYWKLHLSIDYATEGTATDARCYPDADQERPSTLTAGAAETITVRTLRPGLVSMHRAPNGVPVVDEYVTAPPLRTKVTARRTSGLEGSAPRGCFESSTNYEPRYDCGTRSERDGVYLGPLGGIGSWRGFAVQPRTEPREGFDTCTLTDAQRKLPLDFGLELRATPRQLLSSSIPKLVFERTKRFEASAREGSTVSTASGRFRYRVKLVRTGMPGS